MADNARGPAGQDGTSDDNAADASERTLHDPPPPSLLDLGNGEVMCTGTAADMRAAVEWLQRNYPRGVQGERYGPVFGPVLNMGIRMLVEVLDSYHGPDPKKLWLLAFAEKANDRTREGWPGRQTLAHRTGRSQARVSNIASELVSDGVLKRTGGGGRHRGETRYVLLPIALDDDSQGSASTNPMGVNIADPHSPVDNSSQGSARANPKAEVKGSESASQGSARANYQGSAVSPSPAETSYIPHSPHINQPSLSLGAAQAAADGTGQREERDAGVIEGKITSAPRGAPTLAERIDAAVGCTVENAEAFIQHMRRKPNVRSATALLNTAIGNGTIADLYAEESASAAAMAELFSHANGTPAPAPAPSEPEPRQPVPVYEPPEPPWKQVDCPVCKAPPDRFCTNPATGGSAATHHERRLAAGRRLAEETAQ